MNIKTPLAAALLTLASTAMAQPFAPNYSFLCTNFPGQTTTLLSPLLFTGTVPDDATFDCSTPCNMNFGYTSSLFSGGTANTSLGNITLGSGLAPNCTPEQERARSAFLGPCPFGNRACRAYMDRLLIPRNFTDTQRQGEIDGPEGAKAAAKPTEAASATEASPQPGDFNFMGPVQGPPEPAAVEAQDKKAFESAQAQVGRDGIKDVVDLGNGNIAMMREDGTAQVCGRSSKCEEPVPANTLKNPKIEEWVANNNAGYNPNGGVQSLTNPRPGSRGAPSDTGRGSQTGSDTQTSPSTEARNLGVAASNDARATGSYGMRGASAGDTVGGSGFATARAADAVVKVGTEEFKKSVGDLTTFTYSKFGEDFKRNKAEITVGALNDGARANSVNVDSTMDASKHRGGIQAEANSAP